MDFENTVELAEQGPSTFSARIKNIFIGNSPLLAFSTIFFLISLGDAIMSYAAPVYLENVFQSSTMMGIAIAFSAIIGFCADLILGEWFRGKSYSFFLVWTFICAICFPLTLLFLPPFLIFLLLGMAIWGVYYELVQFSNYHFINKYTTKDKRVFSWSLFSIFQSLGYTIGPIIAGFLIVNGINQAFLAALGFYAFGVFGLLIFRRTHKEQHYKEKEEPHKKSILHELKIWLTLEKRVWPLLLFVFTGFLVDSTFWTVGTVLSEQLKKNGAPGEFLLTAYMAPSLFAGLLSAFIGKKIGKKRSVFVLGILSGLAMLPIGFSLNPWVLFSLIFVSSIFGAIGGPLISATYTDYIERLGSKGNDLIGLDGASSNIAYIIGPIFAGVLADFIGFQMTFAVMGGLTVIVSIICLIVTPRKIRLPQVELSKIG